MQSKAKDVTTYIQEAPPERQESLEKLRALFLEVLTGYEEAMEYGGPVYKREGQIEVGFASQKHFIGLYFMIMEVVNQNRPALQGLSVGKGCIRYPNPKKMDFDLIRKLLEDTVQSSERPC